MFFSVIVPVYRVEAYLRQCVDSVLGQSFGDFELILVDDGSPDACPEICDEYAAADARVRVIHRENGGPCGARKAGLQAASGEYVLYVDGDDWLERDALEYLCDVITENQADVVLPAKWHESADGTRLVRECLPDGLYRGGALEKRVYPLILMDESMEHLGYQQIGLAVRRSLLYPCQMAVEDGLRLGEDLVCMMDVYRAMGSMFVSGRAVYHYRVREGALSRGIGGDIYDRLLYLLRVLRRRDSEAGGGFSERIDRYTCFTCFILMEHTAGAGAFSQLDEAGRRMADPVIKEGLSRARFTELKAKRRIALFLIKRDMLRAAYIFLRAYNAAKIPVLAVLKLLGRRFGADGWERYEQD